jgi:hypothetical protein
MTKWLGITKTVSVWHLVDANDSRQLGKVEARDGRFGGFKWSARGRNGNIAAQGIEPTLPAAKACVQKHVRRGKA